MGGWVGGGAGAEAGSCGPSKIKACSVRGFPFFA